MQLGKGKVDGRVAAVHQLALGGPVRTDLVPVELLETGAQLAAEAQHAIADQRQDRVRYRYPTHFGIEPGQVEPVRRLGGGDQAGAAAREGQLFRRSATIDDVLLRCGVGDLVLAWVEPGHRLEMRGKEFAQLPVATADIDCQRRVGRQRCQVGRERRRIFGPEARVGLPTLVEPVLPFRVGAIHRWKLLLRGFA